MAVEDFFYSVGFVFIGLSILVLLREIFLWAIQHGLVGLGTAFFLLGIVSLIVGGAMEPTGIDEKKRGRPRRTGRR